MIGLFAKIKTLYITVFSIGIIGIVIIFNPAEGNWLDAVTFWVAFIFWYRFTYYVFGLLANKEYNKISLTLTNECDPYKYIKAISPLVIKAKNKDLKTFLMLRLAARYGDCGAFEQSKELLDSIQLSKKAASSIRVSNHIMYYNSLITYYLKENNIDKALDYLRLFEDMLQNKKLLRATKTIMEKAYNNKVFQLNMASGNYEGAEDFYMSFFDSGNLYNKVGDKYSLSLIYEHYGRNEEAVQALSYVVENGNKLYIVQQARQKLAELLNAE